jgi:hypothetical protein
MHFYAPFRITSHIFAHLYASFTHVYASLAASSRIFTHLLRIFMHLHAYLRIFSRIFTHLSACDMPLITEATPTSDMGGGGGADLYLSIKWKLTKLSRTSALLMRIARVWRCVK